MAKGAEKLTILDEVAQALGSAYRDSSAVRLQELRALLNLNVLGELLVCQGLLQFNPTRRGSTYQLRHGITFLLIFSHSPMYDQPLSLAGGFAWNGHLT